MAVIKKIIHILAQVEYVLIIIYSVVCIPLVFKMHPVVVLSGSMEPTYSTGSIIYYKTVKKDVLKSGDVITFNTNSNSFVTHRIVSIKNDLYETKGDANNTSDPNKIKYENIKGKVANVSIPYVGYYIKFINDNLVIFVVLALTILLSEFLFSNLGTSDINQNNEGSENNGKITE